MTSGSTRLVRALTLSINVLTVGVAVTAGAKFFSATRTASRPSSQDRVQLGRSLNVEFGKAKRTLLVVVRRECSFCRSEMAFYRELVARRDAIKSPLQVIVVAPDADGDISDYLESQRFRPDAIVYDRGRQLPGVHLTPTLLLTDSTCLLIDTWAGALAEDGHRAVMERLF